MSALAADIADAVVVSLNGAVFSLPVTATRRWRAKASVTAIGNLLTIVLPGPASFELLDRQRDDTQYATDVVSIVKANPDSNAAIDPYIQLMEEIQAHFRAKSLMAGSRGIFCSRRQFVNPGETLVDDVILSDARTFVGAVRLQWRLRQ